MRLSAGLDTWRLERLSQVRGKEAAWQGCKPDSVEGVEPFVMAISLGRRFPDASSDLPGSG